jgi:hypothetical protein
LLLTPRTLTAIGIDEFQWSRAERSSLQAYNQKPKFDWDTNNSFRTLTASACLTENFSASQPKKSLRSKNLQQNGVMF